MEGCTRNMLLLIASALVCIDGFNIDTDFPVIFRGDKNSYFGFAVGLNSNKNGPMALVTAPLGDYVRYKKRETGVLYRCNISTSKCEQVELESLRDISGFTAYKEQYKDLKQNMYLGVSLDIQPGRNGTIVTCAHKWKNHVFSHVHLLNGACYVIDNNLNANTVNKLLPLTKRSLQSIGDPLLNYYLLGMAGFSAAYTEDGTHLLLGAPGLLEGTGSVIDYRMEYTMKNQIPYIARPEQVQEENLRYESYIGYSVSSGKFYEDGKTSYVAGGPRAGDDIGRVYIFEQFSPHNPIIIQETLTGEKMGEYFGSVTLGININNDEYTDLLVGAPLYSRSGISDNGRVYVYISDGKGLQEQNEKLEGSTKPNARFGTAVSAVGDLNMDRYTDIAVGAPYEDDIGAVYIYHGTANGVKAKFVQRIDPEKFQADLSGFGFSIAKGKDIDSNSYPDLLIGAYSSDGAVLLRSRPVISVQADMKFNIKQIKINSSDCEINGINEPCFDITYCLKYSGQYVPDNINMKVILEADIQKFIKSRTYFVEETSTERKSKIEIEVILRKDLYSCYDKKVYVRRNVEDFINPIPFHMTYDVKKQSHFCSTCPVLDETIPNRVAQQVMFWTGCGDDNECSSDLKLMASFVGLSDKAIVVGENKALVLDITTQNTGEPAYQSSVLVCMSHNIEIINKGECNIDSTELLNICLKCSVGNPLQSGKSQSFQLKLDTSNLPSNLTQVEFIIMANTTSNEIEPSDNYVNITFPIIYKASIRLTGSTDSEVIYLRDGMPENIPLVHKYTVAKYMPSPIHSVGLMLSIPIKLAVGQQQFLEISKITVESSKTNRIIGHCRNVSSENMQHEDHFESIHKKDTSGNRYVPADHPDHSGFDTTVVDCNTAICYTLNCTAGPFVHQDIITFHIVGFVNLKNLKEIVGEKDITTIMSEGLATIRDENSRLVSPKRTDFAVVTSSFEKQNLHKTGKIALWIIIVSVVAGIILLLLLIFLLVKLGFFRRKEREEMDKMAESDHLLNANSHGNAREDETALYDDKIRNT